jgi:hypothetical protein
MVMVAVAVVTVMAVVVVSVLVAMAVMARPVVVIGHVSHSNQGGYRRRRV